MKEHDRIGVRRCVDERKVQSVCAKVCREIMSTTPLKEWMGVVYADKEEIQNC